MTKDEKEHIDYEILKRVKEEVDDYRALEHYIKSETRYAVGKVTAVICGLFTLATVLGYFGRNFIAERITHEVLSSVGEEMAKDEVQKLLTSQLGEMINGRVPKFIEATVPQMISNKVSVTEREMGKGFEKRVDEMAIELRKESLLLAEKERSLESKIELVPKMVAARGGMRREYDELRLMMNSTNAVADFVSPAVRDVQRQYWTKKIRQDDYSLLLHRSDGKNTTPEECVDLVHADLDHNCDGAINELVKLGRKEHVSTLVYAVEHSKRLNSVYLAVVGIEKLANVGFPALGIDEVMKWWLVNKTNAIYHSFIEDYQQLVERQRLRFSAEGLTNHVMAASLLEDTVKLMDQHPDFLPLSKSVMLQLVFYPGDAQQRFLGGQKEIYERALKNSRSPMREDDTWWNYKAYHDIFDDCFEQTVKNRLSKSPAFENVMKHSGFYNPKIFSDAIYHWPSMQTNKVSDVRSVAASNIVDAITPKNASQKASAVPEEGISGFVTVDIKKGRRALSELPFAPSENLGDKLIDKQPPQIVAGDAFEWTLDNIEYRYEFDGKAWRDKTGVPSGDIRIPVGRCTIYFERKVDVATQINFTGLVK